MKILLSPAKTMLEEVESFMPQSTPIFLDKTQVLLKSLQALSFAELKDLWSVSDKLAKQNAERIKSMDLNAKTTTALFSFQGLAYKQIAPEVFTQDELNYIEKHLVILSGFYGLIRPFDGIKAYRLEMGSKLKTSKHDDLYSFWGDSLYQALVQSSDIIVNLASDEYANAVKPFFDQAKPRNKKWLQIDFASVEKGILKRKATHAKMARGELVRYMASNNIKNIEDIKQFTYLGFKFSPDFSSDDNYIFIQ